MEIFDSCGISTNATSLCPNGPRDVLYNEQAGPPHYDDWGVVELSLSEVESLSRVHPVEDSIHYTLRVFHRPTQCMCPHAEIEVLQNGTPVAEIRSKGVKAWVKVELAKISRLVKESVPA